MKKLTAIITVLCSVVMLNAQNILVKGFVVDDVTKEGLSLTAIQVKGSALGALTEDNGFFLLPLPRTNLTDSIRISYVGYLPQTLSIANYKEGDTLRIMLGVETVVKGEAVITAMNAKGILTKAIANMKKNFFYDSLISTGLYRQYHKENGKFVRLLEADVSVAFNVKSAYKYAFHELVRTNKMRRSENYETNGDEHGDHLVDLLKENPYSYNRQNFLDPKKLDFYAPKIASENQDEYELSLQYKETSSAKLENARIWVAKETFAITRIEIEKFPNPYYIKSRYANESRWELVNEKDVIETTKQNGKYMVSDITRSYNHHVLNPRTKAVDFIVEETFEMHFDDYETNDISKRITETGKYSSMSELYLTKYGYDTKFWNNYGLLDDYPTPDQVEKDLASHKPLLQQFKDSGL